MPWAGGWGLWTGLASALLALLAWRSLGPLAGAVAGLLFATSIIVLESGVQLYHVGSEPALTAMAFVATAVALRRGLAWVALAGGLIGLATHCHSAALGYVPMLPLAELLIARPSALGPHAHLRSGDLRDLPAVDPLRVAWRRCTAGGADGVTCSGRARGRATGMQPLLLRGLHIAARPVGVYGLGSVAGAAVAVVTLLRAARAGSAAGALARAGGARAGPGGGHRGPALHLGHRQWFRPDSPSSTRRVSSCRW